MMNEELAGTIPVTVGLTEMETLGSVGQVGTEVPEAESAENAWTAPPAPLEAEPARPVEFDVTGWNLDRSELTTLKVRLGEELNDDSLAFLQRSRMDGYLDVPGNEALVDELAQQNSLSLLERAEERERKEAEVKRQHDEAVMDKFECLFDDGNDAENKRKAEELFGEGYWTPHDAMNQVAAVELVADGLYGEYGVKQSGEELRRNLGLPFDADAAVVYGVLKDRFARRKEAKIEHAKMQAVADALAGEIEKVMSLQAIDAEFAQVANHEQRTQSQLHIPDSLGQVIYAPNMSAGYSALRDMPARRQLNESKERVRQAQIARDKAHADRFVSILKGDVQRKVDAMIDGSELPWETKYAIRENVKTALDSEMKNEFWRQFMDGKKPIDFEGSMKETPELYKDAILLRMKHEWERFKRARTRVQEIDDEKQREYREWEKRMNGPVTAEKFLHRSSGVGESRFNIPGAQPEKPFNPISGVRDMRERVWAAKQLNDLARELAREDADTRELILRQFAEKARALSNNKMLSEDQNWFVYFVAQIGELGLDVGTVTAQGAGSVYDLVTDALPGSNLTLEERKIRQHLFETMRAAQLKPGSLAWGSETMGGQLRQGIVQAAGSTLIYASTYGAGAVLSVWDDEANRLMAEGAGFWSAHARGLARGGIEYGTENLGGLTMGSFKGLKMGARLGTRAAGDAVRPLTKWGKMQRFIEAPLVAKTAAVKSLFTPAEGMLTKAAGYMAAGRVAWRQKKYGSAVLRTGAAWTENTLEEAFEEVVGDVAGVPLDRLLAHMFGDPLETIASDDGTVRPWYVETVRRAWGTFTDPGLWAGVVVLGAAGAGLNVGRYTREAAVSSMDAEHIRAAVGCTWREALRIARIADPSKRLPDIGKMARTVDEEVKAGKRTRESVHGNMVEGLRAWALADDGLRSLDIYDDLVAQGKLPEFKKLDKNRYKNRYLVKMRDKEGKITSSEISESALITMLEKKLHEGVAAEIATSVEAGAKNAMIGELRKDSRFVVQEGDAGAHYDELVRRYNAAKGLIEMGRSLDEVVPEIDADRALGDVLAESPKGYKERAWVEWQRERHLDPREANDRKAFEASFATGEFEAPAMNVTLRYGTRAGKVFLRFIKGKAGLKDVLEELVEAGFKSGKFDYVQQGELLRALQEQTGLQGQFMTQEGEFGMGDVIEGISKLALSDVMANTDFYGMPTWMKDAVRTLRQFNTNALDLCKLGAKVAEMHEEGLLPGSLMENVHALMGDAVGYFKGVANVAQSSAMQQAAATAVSVADAPALAEAGLRDVSSMEDDVAEELTVPSEPVSVAEVMERLRALEGTELVNDESGMTAVVNRQQAKKMCSPAARHKSEQNGLSANEHLQAVARVAALFRHAVRLGVFDDVKNGEGQVKIHRLAALVFIRGKMMTAKLTVKESLDKNARRIYSLELMEIEAPGGTLRSASPEGTDSATPGAENILARFREIVKGNVNGSEEADNAVTSPAPVEQDAEDLDDLMEEAATGKTREERNREAAEKTMAALEGGEKPDTGRVPVGKLELSRDVPQWKAGPNEEGESQPLTSQEWDERGVAPLSVWVRTDGRLEVVSGRHRRALARRLGVENVPCEFHYEADGFDAQQARLLDAEMNIRDGNGSSIDFARYCRETGVTKADALARGWFDRRQGYGVSIGIYGSDNLYDAFINGTIGEQQAAKIAQAAPGNDTLQRAGMREVAENKKGADYAVAVMQAAAVAARESGAQQLDLFGADDSALNEARKMAEYATRMKRALRKMIDSSKGAINDPENFGAVTKSKVKDTEGAMHTLANLTAATKRWENFAVHPELAAEARAWDGKSRVTVEADALPPAIELPAYAMNINPETAETLESLQEMAKGKDIVIHNAEYGDFAFEWGRIGREKDGKGGVGLLHVIHQRVLNGFSVQEAARTAVLASIAAQEGTLNEVRMNKHLFEKYGVRAVVAFDEDTRKKIITGFVITELKQPKQAVDEGAAHMSRQLYAQTTLNRRDVVGAAMKEAIAWYEDIVKMYPQDYDRVLSGYVAWLKRKQEAKVRGEAVPPEMEAPSYAMNINPETAETLESLQEMAEGKDIVIHNAEYGDFAFEWGRIGREKDGKGGMGLLHVIHQRVLNGFSVQEAARTAVLASIAAQEGTLAEVRMNKHLFEKYGVRAVVAYNSSTERKVITGFVITSIKQPKQAVDDGAANMSRQLYAQTTLNRRDVVGAAMKEAIAWYEDIVKMYPQDYDRVLSGYVAWLKRKQEAKVRGEAVPPEMEAPSYAMRLTSADVCRTRQEAQAKVGRKGSPLHLENRFLSLTALFTSRSEGKFSHKDSLGRTIDALTEAGMSEEEAKTVHYTAYGNIEALFANGERMEFEMAYKKKDVRKGFLHVYSPFDIEGFSEDFEVNIELEIYQEKGRKPTAYLLNVSIQKRSQAVVRGTSQEGTPILDVPATEVIQSDFPEIVKPQVEEPGYSMRWLGDKQVREAFAQERGNLALSALIDNMALYINKTGELGDTLRLDDDNDREQYINAVHDVAGKLLLLTMALPEKWRPSIDRDLKYLRKYMELAMRGEVDLAAESDWDTWKIIQSEFGRDAKGTEQWLKELGHDKAHKQVEKILGRIKNKMERWGKMQVRQQIQRLVKMATPQKDLVTKRSKRGLMDADSARRVMEVESALNMKEQDWIAGMMEYGDMMSDNEDAASKANFLQVFGCLERMSLSEATHALEELKKYVRDARTSWDEALDKKRAERVRMNRRIVEELGRPDVATVKKNDDLPGAWKNAKGIPADMMNVMQLFAVVSKKGLGFWVDGLRTRFLDADHAMHRSTVHRMLELSKLASRLKYKSYDEFVNELHGEPVEVPGLHAVQSNVWKMRLVAIADAYRMRDLTGPALSAALEAAELSVAEWQQLQDMMDERDEMQADWVEKQAKYNKASKAERVGLTPPVMPPALNNNSFVVTGEDEGAPPSLPLMTKGEALQAILTSEQPRYYRKKRDEKGNLVEEGALPAHDWDEANIQALKDFVGKRVLAMGYKMRDLLSEQKETLKPIYEEEYGTPFPEEENYFPVKFRHPEGSEKIDAKIMREYAGLTPANTSFMKNRVDHFRAMDLNTDALVHFVETSLMVDNWIYTHTIVQDMDATLKAEGVGDVIKNKIGPQDFERLRDSVNVAKRALLRDTASVRRISQVIGRGMAAMAKATLSFKFETWMRQFPAVVNGFVGSDGTVTFREYMKAMSHLKRGKARMGFKQMLHSELMQERMRRHYEELEGKSRNKKDPSTWADRAVEAGLSPMEKTDAWATTFSLVPVWNIYFERAKQKGMSDDEAEAQAWAAVDDALARGAQPNGVFHKSLFSSSNSIMVRAMGYMLSEDWGKAGQIASLWKSGSRVKAAQAWLMYGALNALVSFILDMLRYDEDEWEKRHWWDYLTNLVLGPFAGMPIVGAGLAELLSFVTNITLAAAGSDARLHGTAGSSQAFLDYGRVGKDFTRLYNLFADDKSHDFQDWVVAAKSVLATAGGVTRALTNSRGASWLMFGAALANPARTVANIKHAVFD